jgi:arylformamidase
MRVARNLVYIRHPRAESLYTTLDIYTPVQEPSQLWPVVVYVHGGFWRSGSKESVAAKPAWFLERGYVFVSVNYRLSIHSPNDSLRFAHNVTFPKHTEDVASALAYLQKHVQDYGGDPDAFFLMGHSAGGYLAAEVSLHGAFLPQAGFTPAALRGIVALDPGVLDLRWAYAHGDSLQKVRYRNAFGSGIDTLHAASPVAQVQALPLPEPGKDHVPARVPPVLLMHVRDYSYKQGRKLAHELFIRHLPVTLLYYPNLSHGLLDTHLGHPGDPMGLELAQTITDWLGDQLRHWTPKLKSNQALEFQISESKSERVN